MNQNFLHDIKNKIKSGQPKEAFALLKAQSHPNDDYAQLHAYYNLLREIPTAQLNLKPIKIALLASSTVSHFKNCLETWLAFEGFCAQIWEAEYDTIHQTILDENSPLYQFKPDIVLVFINFRDIKISEAITHQSHPKDIEQVVQDEIQNFVNLWDVLQKRLNCFIIQNNVDTPSVRILGNYEAGSPGSRLNMLRLFNIKLAHSARPGVAIFDIEHLSGVIGKNVWTDSRYWHHSKHMFAINASGFIAYRLTKLIGAIKGTAKKCLVIDLDGTLWGGVIGDDGLDGIELGQGAAGEAFVAFQEYLWQLKNRGILLAVCSKNDSRLAQEPFIKHPDMKLKLEDIAVFKANWNNKVDNIKEIASLLNIGLDSLVFIDDNPAERALVKDLMPEVTVVELPDEPAEYIKAIDELALFETISLSDEDRNRSALYRDNAIRQNFQSKFTDLSEYLRSLNMEALVSPFDANRLPRITQLINKSNQFHLTTTRYTESQIQQMAKSPDHHCLYFCLKDRFGDNGLVSAVISKAINPDTLLIDTWVMSCRVLSRTMEELILNEIVLLAKDRHFTKIIGKYIPTAKNNLVAEIYGKLGFKLIDNKNGTTLWELDLSANFAPRQTFIEKVKEHGLAHHKKTTNIT